MVEPGSGRKRPTVAIDLLAGRRHGTRRVGACESMSRRDSDRVVLEAVRAFFSVAKGFDGRTAEPLWMSRLRLLLQESEAATPDELARALGGSTPSLARTYRAYQREGLPETL